MKIGIAFSGGGHYLEAMNACKALLAEGQHSYFYVTYRQKHRPAGNMRVHYVAHPKHGWAIRRAALLLVNFVQSLAVYAKEKPDLIISTGADVTLSIMLIAKLYRKKLIFIESGANVTKPSLTGRLVYRFADLFLIQWEELKPHYPRAIYGGPLL
ncbi:PssD/Cps14F family polysaccharide biosynthesis glycosyltransferase [Hymenobacter terrestris]|uniref:Polysaccharide biosynthesis protein n=1 Tax=Hymenobacter terrestris TaxID=2748310 RepID=A0ABX2Q554_9BACT|nr:PssD/Cps14F family polysaccharide biosynthesis glycosyltransferase [Hymenobacter terrestris]NVO86108.1 polysaccharide biosynthesis protein [Hymenobacter terrestris]